MNRKMLFIWLLMFSLIYAEEPLKYGVKVGAGLSSAPFSDKDNLLLSGEFKSRAGVNFGVILNLPYSGNLSIYSELEYQARGSKEEILVTVGGDIPDQTIPANLVIVQDNLFEYLSLGSGARWTFGANGFRPFVNTGISLNTLLREDSGFGDLNFDTKRFVWGLEFGGGIVFAILSPGELFVEIKYDLDITTALERDPNLPIEFDMKHRWLSISLGIMLP